MRDNDRGKTYAAEDMVANITAPGGEIEAYGTRITVPVERRFGDIDSIQRYVDAVLDLNWLKSEWPDLGSIKVRNRKGTKSAHYQDGEIAINDSREGKWALRELVVLHEVAHHLTNGADRAHGPEFRAAFLRLVEEIIGHETAWLLRIEYSLRGL